LVLERRQRGRATFGAAHQHLLREGHRRPRRLEVAIIPLVYGGLKALGRRDRGLVESLEARIDELARQLGELTAKVEQIAEGQAELRTRTRRTQALTARTYEALHDWPALLRAARRTPEYEPAFEEREPLVSIPIPTFNSAETLVERALASALSQTHRNWEAIVVGDHCTDDTEQRVLAIGDPRIRFHNLGVREPDPDDPWERWAVRGSVPRSVGTEMATGRWIAPLSHDDAWDADHLETLVREAQAHHAEIAYSQMRTVAGDDTVRLPAGSIGTFPPRLGQWGWQSAIFHGCLRFLRYDRTCAFASEPNDWNMARRAWEAGVRFHHVPRETVTLFAYDRSGAIEAELAARGLQRPATTDLP
jgi:Glycosyl transferase family 2